MLELLFFRVWVCAQCKSEYDMDEIEHSLIEVIQRKSMGYVLQDLKCIKCSGVSNMVRPRKN